MLTLQKVKVLPFDKEVVKMAVMINKQLKQKRKQIDLADLFIAAFQNLKDEFKEKVLVTPEALKLAQTYVDEKVVGETGLDDCIHIATATLNKVDMLANWNFKHIVNVYRAQ